jgi:tetratricopeptide (TPR) repeat protein
VRKFSPTAILVFALALAGSAGGCAVRIPFLSFPSESEADSTAPGTQTRSQEPQQADRTEANATATRRGQSEYTPPPLSARAATAPRAENPLTATFKKATRSLADALTIKPRVIPADDPTRLSTDPGPIDAELYVSAARLMENRGEFLAAQQQYEKALEVETNCLAALVGLSRLYHRQGRMDEAIRLCHLAVEVHPESGLAHNDLGLCYARRMQVERAVESLSAAVQLQPESQLYRNNLAAALVLAGRIEEARMHLAQVHGSAITEYNLGYLLHKQGKRDAARDHFQRALQLDPALRPAAQMLLSYRRQEPGVNRTPQRTLTHGEAPRPPVRAPADLAVDAPRPERPETQEPAPRFPPALTDVPPTPAQADPPVADQRARPPVRDPVRSSLPDSPSELPRQGPQQDWPVIRSDAPRRPAVEPSSDGNDVADTMRAPPDNEDEADNVRTPPDFGPRVPLSVDERPDQVGPRPPMQVEKDPAPAEPEVNAPPPAPQAEFLRAPIRDLRIKRDGRFTPTNPSTPPDQSFAPDPYRNVPSMPSEPSTNARANRMDEPAVVRDALRGEEPTSPRDLPAEPPPTPRRWPPTPSNATGGELPESWYTGDFSFVPRRIAPPNDEPPPRRPTAEPPVPDATSPAPIWLSPEDR